MSDPCLLALAVFEGLVHGQYIAQHCGIPCQVVIRPVRMARRSGLSVDYRVV